MDFSDMACDFAAAGGAVFENQKSWPGGVRSDEVTLRAETAAVLGKPAGRYATILFSRDLSGFSRLIPIMHNYAARLINMDSPGSVMILGLGNPGLTADSFGDRCLKEIETGEGRSRVCCVAPGVMGLTGIDSSEHVKAMIGLIKPDLVVMLDSLMTSDPARMLNSVQISDAPLPFGGALNPKRRVLETIPEGMRVLSIGYATTMLLRLRGSAADPQDTGERIAVTPADVDASVEEMSAACARLLNGLFF